MAVGAGKIQAREGRKATFIIAKTGNAVKNGLKQASDHGPFLDKLGDHGDLACERHLLEAGAVGRR
jgi:hypothetical protein